MKVMVYEGPRQLRLEEMKDYPLKESEVRIQILFTGTKQHGRLTGKVKS